MIPQFDIDDVLDALGEVARPEILKEWAPASCIASTRIGIDVLAYFGVEAEPMIVTVTAYNAPAVAQIVEHGEIQEWKNGAYGVGIHATTELHPPDQDHPWLGGHLVIVVPTDPVVVVDLSADQIARPHRKIFTEPCAFECSESFIDGSGFVAVPLAGGGASIYRRGEFTPFEDAPDWTMKATVGKPDRAAGKKRVTGKIIREMKRRLK